MAWIPTLATVGLEALDDQRVLRPDVKYVSPWSIDGPDTRPERPSILDALRRFKSARRGRPDVADALPVSTGRKHKPLPGQTKLPT